MKQTQEKLLNRIGSKGSSAWDLAREAGVSLATVRRNLKPLVEAGTLDSGFEYGERYYYLPGTKPIQTTFVVKGRGIPRCPVCKQEVEVNTHETTGALLLTCRCGWLAREVKVETTYESGRPCEGCGKARTDTDYNTLLCPTCRAEEDAWFEANKK